MSVVRHSGVSVVPAKHSNIRVATALGSAAVHRAAMAATPHAPASRHVSTRAAVTPPMASTRAGAACSMAAGPNPGRPGWEGVSQIGPRKT